MVRDPETVKERVCVCVWFYLLAADDTVSFLVTEVESLFRPDVPPLAIQDIE